MTSSETYGRKARPPKACARARPNTGSAQASVTAAGWPRATSAAKVGPDSTATGDPAGRAAAAASLISASDPCSTPLAQITAGTGRDSFSASLAQTPRKCWAGVTSSSASHAAKSLRSSVARKAGSRVIPGR